MKMTALRPDRILTPPLRAAALLFAAFAISCPALRADDTPSAAPAKSGPAPGDIKDSGYAPSPFRFSVGVHAGYDDNNNTAPDGLEADSFFTGIAGEYSGLFGTDRTSLRLALSGGLDYFPDLDTDEVQYRARFSYDLVHKLNPRTTLSLGGFAGYERNPDFTTGFTHTYVGDNEYFYTSNTAGIRYLWAPKFSTFSRYTLNYIIYPDQEAIGGAGDDRFEHTFAQEFRFLWKPKTTLVAEYRYGLINYTEKASDPRDSESHFFLGGVEHQISPRSKTYLRAGVEQRDYDGYGSDTAPYFEWNTDYALGPVTSISWLNRYSIEQSFRGPGLKNEAFRTGLRFNHAFSERLKFNGSVFYAYNNYEAFVDPNVRTVVTRSTSSERAAAKALNNGKPFTQPIVTKVTTISQGKELNAKGIPVLTDVESVKTTTVYPDGRTVTTTVINSSEQPAVRDFDEQAIDASVGLEYFFTPMLSTYLSYTYTKVISDEDLHEYDRNRAYIGLRANF